MSVARLIRLSGIFSFLSPPAETKVVSSMLAGPEDAAVGFVGLLVSAPHLEESGPSICYISLAAF